jgi:hypothetical protein
MSTQNDLRVNLSRNWLRTEFTTDITYNSFLLLESSDSVLTEGGDPVLLEEKTAEGVDDHKSASGIEFNSYRVTYSEETNNIYTYTQDGTSQITGLSLGYAGKGNFYDSGSTLIFWYVESGDGNNVYETGSSVYVKQYASNNGTSWSGSTIVYEPDNVNCVLADTCPIESSGYIVEGVSVGSDYSTYELIYSTGSTDIVFTQFGFFDGFKASGDHGSKSGERLRASISANNGTDKVFIPFNEQLNGDIYRSGVRRVETDGANVFGEENIYERTYDSSYQADNFYLTSLSVGNTHDFVGVANMRSDDRKSESLYTLRVARQGDGQVGQGDIAKVETYKQSYKDTNTTFLDLPGLVQSGGAMTLYTGTSQLRYTLEGGSATDVSNMCMGSVIDNDEVRLDLGNQR